MGYLIFKALYLKTTFLTLKFNAIAVFIPRGPKISIHHLQVIIKNRRAKHFEISISGPRGSGFLRNRPKNAVFGPKLDP